MAEKGPDAQSTPPNMDIETRTAPGGGLPQSENIRRRRRSRNIIISVIFLIIFHSLIIITLDLTVFRIRTPKYVLKSVTIDNLIVTSSTNSSPSFTMKLNADVSIKNNNFGPYKYDDCYINFLYRGNRVADDLVEEAGAKSLSTKVLKMSLNVTYNSGGSSDNARLLRSDISTGTLVLRSESKMRGHVEVLKILKRADKYPNMDCSITIDLAVEVVRLVQCY